MLGLAIGDSEDGAFWTEFLQSLRARGLAASSSSISDQHLGLKAAIAAVFVGASWQRCRVHFMRNVLARVPADPVPDGGRRHPDDLRPARCRPRRPRQVEPRSQPRLEGQFPDRRHQCSTSRGRRAAAFASFPRGHWSKIWSTNPLERLNAEIKRRTRVVGIFPNDAASCG